jgi:hypothetical protein
MRETSRYVSIHTQKERERENGTTKFTSSFPLKERSLPLFPLYYYCHYYYYYELLYSNETNSLRSINESRVSPYHHLPRIQILTFPALSLPPNYPLSYPRDLHHYFLSSLLFSLLYSLLYRGSGFEWWLVSTISS